MAYISLRADEITVVMKNGKVRLQAVWHDKSGEIADQVTIVLPFAEARKLCDAFRHEENTARHRFENLFLEENQD